MSWRDKFYSAVKKYVENIRPDIDIAEVTYVDQDTYDAGGCETCSYTVTQTTVGYLNSKGRSLLVTFDMSLVDFMNTI